MSAIQFGGTTYSDSVKADIVAKTDGTAVNSSALTFTSLVIVAGVKIYVRFRSVRINQAFYVIKSFSGMKIVDGTVHASDFNVSDLRVLV